MYLERAKEVDEKMAENWKADADGILIFVRSYFSHTSHRLISRRLVCFPLLLLR